MNGIFIIIMFTCDINWSRFVLIWVWFNLCELWNIPSRRKPFIEIFIFNFVCRKKHIYHSILGQTNKQIFCYICKQIHQNHKLQNANLIWMYHASLLHMQSLALQMKSIWNHSWNFTHSCWGRFTSKPPRKVNYRNE